MDWIDLHQKLQNSHTLHQSPVKENASSLRRSGGKTFQIMQDYISHPVPVSVTSWIYYHYKYDAGLEFWYQAFEFCWWCLCLHLQYNYGNGGAEQRSIWKWKILWPISIWIYEGLSRCGERSLNLSASCTGERYLSFYKYSNTSTIHSKLGSI